ncbi:MAG: ATP-binding protein, partial [Sulfurovaceae bacterium]|nr:ATP-binding protein [Sulfurovaceae bacterium]
NDDEELNKAISRSQFSNEIYMKSLVYFPSGIDDIKKVADEFVKSFYFFLKEKDYRPSEVKAHFHKYMQNIFNGLDLTFKYSHLDRDDNVWFTNDNEEEFEIKELSTGEKTLLSKVMYLYFLGYKDKVILIDEPELSLHPSWQNKVLKIYENFAIKNNCQIIIATHSPHIIASANNRYIRFLEKNKEGHISVINDVQAYGRDIEWVLQQMGVKNLRVSEVLEKFANCQQLLNDEKYDEAEICINDLEKEIGKNDRQIMNLRNSLFFERD